MSEFCTNCDAFKYCQLMSAIIAGKNNAGILDKETIERNPGFRKCPDYTVIIENYQPVIPEQEKLTQK